VPCIPSSIVHRPSSITPSRFTFHVSRFTFHVRASPIQAVPTHLPPRDQLEAVPAAARTAPGLQLLDGGELPARLAAHRYLPVALGAHVCPQRGPHLAGVERPGVLPLDERLRVLGGIQ